jgi:hypothetical protein
MKKIAPNDHEAKSADLVAAIIDQLKALFPEAFVEGKTTSSYSQSCQWGRWRGPVDV